MIIVFITRAENMIVETNNIFEFKRVDGLYIEN